jgi:hypothetical protein
MLGRSLVERDGGKQKDRARAHSCPGPAAPAHRFRQLCALCSPLTLSDARIHLASHLARRRRRRICSSRCAQLLSHAVLVAFLLDVILLRHGLLRTASTPTRFLCSLLGSPNASGVLFNAFEHKLERARTGLRPKALATQLRSLSSAYKPDIRESQHRARGPAAARRRLVQEWGRKS